MFDSVQLLCLAAAAVLDSVLFLALLEPRNRRYVSLPVMLLTAGAWLWHVGAFLVVLLAEMTSPVAVELRRACMALMAFGLLLMPSAMIHGVCRLLGNGPLLRTRADWRHALAYLPLGVMIPTVYLLAQGRPGTFLSALEPLVIPYVVGLAVVNVVTAATFLLLRARVGVPRAGQFFLSMAVVLLAMTALQLFVFLRARFAWPAGEDTWLLLVTLSPAVPALLFAYFVARYNFMRLILERTLVYAALLIGLLLLHRIAFEDLTADRPERYRVHLGILHGMAVVAAILVYQPFRQRAAEALRYLFGERVAPIRERTRQLAMELSARSGQPPPELLAWFVEAARAGLRAEYVAAWLFAPDGEGGIDAGRCGTTERLPDSDALALHAELKSAGALLCTPRDVLSRDSADRLREAEASLAAVLAHQRIAGLLLVGRRSGRWPLSEEETNAVALLAEQLAVTLDNSLLQTERLAAERRALHSEKLSALGLLASSIAHEVKNPLSAIKTIATVLAEDLGPDSRHAEDLRLILGEVDRLSTTTSQLLEFARPAPAPAPTAVCAVLEGILRLMRHLVRQQGVTLRTALEDGLPPVRADGYALREIFYNLLSNSIEAAGPGGLVSVACRRVDGYILAEVSDSGPGVAPEVRARLFEPFLTTKEAGTGLGLYLVGRRVRELGGDIRCDSAPGRGTTFTVQLPHGDS